MPVGLFLFGVFFSGCNIRHAQTPSDQNANIAYSNQNANTKRLVSTEDEVLTLVKTATTYNGDKARVELLSLPQSDVVPALQRLKAKSNSDDPVHVELAFVFCYIGIDYETNRQIVTGALAA